jgi:hypothetical protein
VWPWAHRLVRRCLRPARPLHAPQELGALRAEAEAQRLAARAADDRARAAEGVALDARRQCEQAAGTMSRLIDESSELVAKINAQANALAGGAGRERLRRMGMGAWGRVGLGGCAGDQGTLFAGKAHLCGRVCGATARADLQSAVEQREAALRQLEARLPLEADPDAAAEPEPHAPGAPPAAAAPAGWGLAREGSASGRPGTAPSASRGGGGGAAAGAVAAAHARRRSLGGSSLSGAVGEPDWLARPPEAGWELVGSETWKLVMLAEEVRRLVGEAALHATANAAAAATRRVRRAEVAADDGAEPVVAPAAELASGPGARAGGSGEEGGAGVLGPRWGAGPEGVLGPDLGVILSRLEGLAARQLGPSETAACILELAAVGEEGARVWDFPRRTRHEVFRVRVQLLPGQTAACGVARSTLLVLATRAVTRVHSFALLRPAVHGGPGGHAGGGAAAGGGDARRRAGQRRALAQRGGPSTAAPPG